jgi:hypothetical protein
MAMTLCSSALRVTAILSTVLPAASTLDLADMPFAPVAAVPVDPI